MTGEEMERAIEFLLKSQANSDAKLDRLTEQVTELTGQVTELGKQLADTDRRLQMHAETQSEFIGIVLRHTEEQSRINESHSRGVEELRTALRELAAAQARTEESLRGTNENQKQTDERLARLAATVERYIEGRG